MVQFFLVLPTYQKYDIRIFIALICSPGPVLNGVVVSRGPYLVGTQVKYKCNQGYTMVGDSVLNCVDKGTTAGWYEDLPHCLTRCIKQNEKIVQRSGKYSCGKMFVWFIYIYIYIDYCRILVCRSIYFIFMKQLSSIYLKGCDHVKSQLFPFYLCNRHTICSRQLHVQSKQYKQIIC